MISSLLAVSLQYGGSYSWEQAKIGLHFLEVHADHHSFLLTCFCASHLPLVATFHFYISS